MSATNVARAGKRGNICVGNNVSATMCPRLSGPLSTACTLYLKLITLISNRAHVTENFQLINTAILCLNIRRK